MTLQKNRRKNERGDLQRDAVHVVQSSKAIIKKTVLGRVWWSQTGQGGLFFGPIWDFGHFSAYDIARLLKPAKQLKLIRTRDEDQILQFNTTKEVKVSP